MAPTKYDPNSPLEQPVPLPSAPLVQLCTGVTLQPPLSRRGKGPGLICFLPASPSGPGAHTLDPAPVQKWAEEGFAVVGIDSSVDKRDVADAITTAIEELQKRDDVDVKDKFGVLGMHVYDPAVVDALVACAPHFPAIIAFVSYGSPWPSSHLPTQQHLPNSCSPSTPGPDSFSYPPATSAFFVLPTHADAFEPSSAALAHTRTLTFLKKRIDGPWFDLEAIWDEHTYFEFEARSVAQTMGTMVAEPYVNHVPTMTGGTGRAALTAFYRDHFIFKNPSNTSMELVSRTIGIDRVVDEFVYRCDHDCEIDWLLPGVPPTGKVLAIPFIAVVNIRGDRLYHEHIWWDQGTALTQCGLLPSHVPLDSDRQLRLPVAGVSTAEKLLNERLESNAMFGQDWGVSQ
ncbi:hypothetical protein PLICRDRAFT_160653 [Plicaturopsis crispa FD-325 SS-3]|nr:hypothetical protein PLICRDRAFT_160653 [Plicaturopsis crispa FD-325 SS-3]